jgi:hemerythrin superfamily protein
MTDRLKAELPKMLEEHKAVVAALKNLIAAAEEEKKLEHARFAEKLMLHAQTEEEVLYPAAILVGEYLKLKLKS